MKKPYILGAIFARGGSKGIPRKNIKELAGKPLITYAIEMGRSISLIDRLIVSTDDKEIADIAKKYGAEVPFVRPDELAKDDSPELLSWKHAIKTIESQSGKKVDILVSIPTTSPLRIKEDVEKCLKTLLDSDADIVITISEALRNPYFNMVYMDDKGYAKSVIHTDKVFGGRQETPKVYDITTVAYAARSAYILKAKKLREGKVKTVIIPRERALDIDTLLDFEIAEFLISKRKGKI